MMSNYIFQSSTQAEFGLVAALSRIVRGGRPVLFLVLLSWLMVTHSFGQTPGRAVVTQPIQWSFLSSTIKLNPKYGIFAEQQVGLASGKNMQHVIRAGFDYAISKKVSIIPIGYAYTWNYQYGKQPNAFANNEYTIWEQVTFKHKVSRAAASQRVRFEERYIQTHSMGANSEVVDNGYNNHQFRVRYRAQANIPLNKKKIEPKTIYLSVWDEVFMSWGKLVTYHKPDQNRFFAGPGYQVTKDLSMQAGYFYQMLVKANGARQENNIGVLLQVNYNFSMNK